MSNLKTAYQGDAVFSSCGEYRSWLTRLIDPANPRVLACMGLNPSKAGAINNDPTIAKMEKYAIRWNCGLLAMVNASDYIATKPKYLKLAVRDGVPIQSDDLSIDIPLRASTARARAMKMVQDMGGVFLVMFGANILKISKPWLLQLASEMDYTTPMCIKTNVDGTPVHALYQRDAIDVADLVPWRV